jgi:hypothetical protein
VSGPGSRPRGRLRRSNCSGPGISRRRRGGGFSYLDPEGGRVTDEDALERIRELAIPPAWREVWICGDPYGHIQAPGLDEAGRKQYLYHERWQLRAAQRKFESMREWSPTSGRRRSCSELSLRPALMQSGSSNWLARRAACGGSLRGRSTNWSHPCVANAILPSLSFCVPAASVASVRSLSASLRLG